MMNNEPGTAKSRYLALEQDRMPYLQRARNCSQFTIPSLFPPEGSTGATQLYQPYQSLGARGVNNLAGKLLMSLLPPQAAFFRLLLDDSALRDINPPLQDAEREQIDLGLSLVEQSVLKEVEFRNIRPGAFEALKNLIVGGNTLIYLPKVGMRVFNLAHYVVDRDPEGNIIEIVVKEMVSPLALPESVRKEVSERMEKDQKFVELYTHIERRDRYYHVYQQAQGLEIPGSVGSWPLDKLPYLALRWTRIDGENYGRGHCEEYIGDLLSLEGLAKAIVEAAAAAAKVLWLVNPNGTTNPKDLEAPNNAVRPGNKEDVTVLQMEKFADFQFAGNTASTLESRLSYAFLLNSAVQRQAERVTAEEIRYMANEIENALGGVYSVIASEFQLPLVKLLMAQMTKEDRLPPLPAKMVKPTIVTGIDALGRSQELMRLSASLATISQLIGPEVTAQYTNASDLMTRVFTANGIDPKGLVRSAQEVQQQQQAMQMQSMAQKVGPNVVKAISDHSLAAQQQAQQPTQTNG
jgi:hypothetical protein